jgi:Tfp pilus assembly protein PilE
MSRLRKEKRHNRHEDGFTLLDLAIILLVIGFITAPILNEYNNWKKRATKDGTVAKIADIELALEQYYFENKSYPCPADPTVGPDTIIPIALPQFGEENRAAAVAPAVGNCIEIGPPQTVLSGAVPFKALGLTEDAALDQWGRKITYAVTSTKTHPNTYAGAPGQITINKPFEQVELGGDRDRIDCRVNVSNPTVTNIDLVLLSHGPTGYGAFANNGTVTRACTVAAEGENCDNDDTFLFPECSASSVDDASFYDDIFYNEYGSGVANLPGKWSTTPKRMWEEGENENDAGSEAGYFGISNGDPQHAIDVIGNIKTTNLDSTDDEADQKRGNTLASQYCKSDGSDCFNPNSISGDDADMRCNDSNVGVRGFGNNAATCLTLPVSNQSCPAGRYIIGITEAGVVKCSS